MDQFINIHRITNCALTLDRDNILRSDSLFIRFSFADFGNFGFSLIAFTEDWMMEAVSKLMDGTRRLHSNKDRDNLS